MNCFVEEVAWQGRVKQAPSSNATTVTGHCESFYLSFLVSFLASSFPQLIFRFPRYKLSRLLVAAQPELDPDNCLVVTFEKEDETFTA